MPSNVITTGALAIVLYFDFSDTFEAKFLAMDNGPQYFYYYET